MLENPEPVIIAPLFPEIQARSISLLKNLTAKDWQKPTACINWSVKNVAQHLLGNDIGNLSRRRDGLVSNQSITGWNELVTFINESNQNWINATNYFSQQLLIDLLEFVGSQMSEYFLGLDPFAMGGAVSWVGPEPAPIWLDLAREYTERWHHQQHIRDAVEKPGLKQPKYFSPVLATFIRALPKAFQKVIADEDTSITVTITGESGGRWSILRKEKQWILYSGAPARSDTEIIMDQEIAWRLFTRGLSKNQSQPNIKILGNQRLGSNIFNMVSIIA